MFVLESNAYLVIPIHHLQLIRGSVCRLKPTRFTRLLLRPSSGQPGIWDVGISDTCIRGGYNCQEIVVEIAWDSFGV
jgi:hypothetical protein